MKPKNVLFMANDPLIIEDAPEPTDIIWDHLGAKYLTQLKYRLYTYGITILLLAISTYI